MWILRHHPRKVPGYPAMPCGHVESRVKEEFTSAVFCAGKMHLLSFRGCGTDKPSSNKKKIVTALNKNVLCYVPAEGGNCNPSNSNQIAQDWSFSTSPLRRSWAKAMFWCFNLIFFKLRLLVALPPSVFGSSNINHTKSRILAICQRQEWERHSICRWEKVCSSSFNLISYKIRWFHRSTDIVTEDAGECSLVAELVRFTKAIFSRHPDMQPDYQSASQALNLFLTATVLRSSRCAAFAEMLRRRH